MKTRETSLWAWVRGAMKERPTYLHMQRIENSLEPGTPDAEGYYYAHGQFWLELKTAARPKRASTPIRFETRNREAQARWLARRWRVGGAAWILCQVGSGHAARRYLIPGKYAPEIWAHGALESRLAALSACPVENPSPSVLLSYAAGRAAATLEYVPDQ